MTVALNVQLRLAARAVAAFTLLGLASCGGTASPSRVTSPAPNPASGQSGGSGASGAAASSQATASQLTFAVPTLGLEHFDPSKTTNLFALSQASIGGPIFEALYVPTPPNGAPKPYLLQSATMASDASSWTLKLRPGIHFSNGDPMTADDVKFSLERYMSPESTSQSHNVLKDSISSIDVVDPLTVQLHLKRPFVNLPYTVIWGNEAIVLPSKYINQVGWQAFEQKPIGSGPYIVSEHKAGQSVTYQPSPDYWGPSKPVFKQIKLVVVPEEQSRIAMVQSGQADIVQVTATGKQQAETAGLKTHLVPDVGSFGVVYFGDFGSYPDNPLKSLQVRKALSLAVDNQAIMKAIAPGLGELGTLPYKADPAQGVPDLPPVPYDPNQAKQLLQQAGYANGLNLKLWVIDGQLCSADQARQYGQAIAAYWKTIGVSTQITPVDVAVIRPKMTARPNAPDIVGTASTFCGSMGNGLTQLTSYFYSGSTFAFTEVADKDVEAALSAKSVDQQNKAVTAAYTKAYENYSMIYSFFTGAAYAGNSKLVGYPVIPAYADMLLWWVQPRPDIVR